MMLKDSKAIQRLADESPDIFTRIKDVITGIVNDIKNAFKGVKGSTYEYKRMEELLDDWEGVQKLWDDAFVSASKNANKANKAAAGEVVSIGRNISYCARMSFAAQVDAILGDAKNNKEYVASHVLVSETTPEVYVNEFDLPDLPVLMTAEHVYSTSVSEDKAKADKRYRNGKNYHDLGEILKKIPDAVKNPIIVAMQPFGKGRFENNYIRANVVVSTYGKNISNYVKTALDDERILWVDKGKSRMLNLNPRLQLSSIIQTFDFSNNLSRYRQIVNSIIRKKSKNDTGNIQFSLRDTEYGKYIDEGIVDFVEDVRAGKYNYNVKHVISESIPQRLADDIKKITGIKLDAENCSNDINKNSIEHITKRHGENGEQDKTMAVSENIGLIDYVVNNYDSIKLGDKNTRAYRNSDNTSAKTIVLSKKIGEDGSYYVVEAVPELTKGSAIHVMSAYIGNKKGASQVSHAESPPPTSESELAPTPDNKIPQERGYVKESLRDNRSNREILVNALESTAKNDTEKQILEDYKQMADTLDMFESLKKEKQKAMRTSVR